MAEKKKRSRTKKKSTAKKKTTRKRTPHKKAKRTAHKKAATKTKAAPKVSPVTINMPPFPAPVLPKPRPAVSEKEENLSRILIENFVSLQKVQTNLSTKIDDLSTKISKLLELFEISAKSLADREFEIEKDNRETLEKMNTLLDQNKILARGVSLMHERMPYDQFPHPSQPQLPPQQPQPIPQPQQNYSHMQEMSPSPPPFQQPPMNLQTQKRPLAQEMSEPPSLGTPSIMSTNPPRRKKLSPPGDINSDPDLPEVPEPPESPEDDYFSQER